MSGDWGLEMNGTEARLVQKVLEERSVPLSDTTNSIALTFDGEEETSIGEEVEQKDLELTSTPHSTLEFMKYGGKKALLLDCHSPEDKVGQEKEDENDILSIREVSFQTTG
ncbi:hypothetical protein MC885_006294 [Smutsia gigantea]|nr:hypothetical protein MC885_006294 [Smutsia gigantea]